LNTHKYLADHRREELLGGVEEDGIYTVDNRSQLSIQLYMSQALSVA